MYENVRRRQRELHGLVRSGLRWLKIGSAPSLE